MLRFSHYRWEKTIALIIFVTGLCLSLLIPTWQIPDEYAHLNMIGNSIGVSDFEENILESVAVDKNRIEFNYDEKVDLEDQKVTLSNSVAYSRKEMLPHRVSLGMIKYLPAICGMELGILFGVPAYWVLQLGELFSLLFYTFICYCALKLLPIKKEMMAFIMLFPMALQQAGSISYDAVLLPLCFLLISYIFYLKFDKTEIKLKDVMLVLCIWAVVSYIKVPYIFLILLVFMIPLNKINIYIGRININEQLIKKVRIPCMAIAGIGLLIGVYIVRYNKWIQIVYGFIVEWKRGIYLLYVTGKTWREFLMISTVGNFGWLDTPMAYSAVLLVYFVMVGIAFVNCEEKGEKKMERWDVLVIGGTFLILCLFTTLAMVNHTITVTLFGSESSNIPYNIREALYQIPYVGGLQGRYYLPFVCLPFCLIPQKMIISHKKAKIIFVGIEIVLYLYVLWLLLHRYWIS